MPEVKHIPCDFCDKKFKFSSTYKIHINKHKRYTNDQQSGNKTTERKQSGDSVNSSNQQSEITSAKSSDSTCPDEITTSKKEIETDADSKTKSNASKQPIERSNTADSATQKKNKKGRKTVKEKSKEMVKDNPDKLTLVFACKICLKLFSTKQTLTVHQKKHLGVKYDCEQCGASFTSKHSLKVHKQGHQNLKPWKCEICGAQFSQSGHLKRHLKIHSGKREEICEQCGKCFVDKDGLRAHKLTHDQDSEFICTVCGVALKLKSSLRSHMKQHTGNKHYTCSTCHRSFTQRQTYLEHVKLHSDSSVKRKAYLTPVMENCPLCDKGFADCSGLRKHMKKHESGTLKRFKASHVVVVGDSRRSNKQLEIQVQSSDIGLNPSNHGASYLRSIDGKGANYVDGNKRNEITLHVVRSHGGHNSQKNSQSEYTISETSEGQQHGSLSMTYPEDLGRVICNDKTAVLINNCTEVLITSHARLTNHVNPTVTDDVHTVSISPTNSVNPAQTVTDNVQNIAISPSNSVNLRQTDTDNVQNITISPTNSRQTDTDNVQNIAISPTNSRQTVSDNVQNITISYLEDQYQNKEPDTYSGCHKPYSGSHENDPVLRGMRPLVTQAQTDNVCDSENSVSSTDLSNRSDDLFDKSVLETKLTLSKSELVRKGKVSRQKSKVCNIRQKNYVDGNTKYHTIEICHDDVDDDDDNIIDDCTVCDKDEPEYIPDLENQQHCSVDSSNSESYRVIDESIIQTNSKFDDINSHTNTDKHMGNFHEDTKKSKTEISNKTPDYGLLKDASHRNKSLNGKDNL